MDKDEFLTAMNRVAEALPDKSSPEVTALFIANIILIYEQERRVAAYDDGGNYYFGRCYGRRKSGR